MLLGRRSTADEENSICLEGSGYGSLKRCGSKASPLKDGPHNNIDHLNQTEAIERGQHYSYHDHPSQFTKSKGISSAFSNRNDLVDANHVLSALDPTYDKFSLSADAYVLTLVFELQCIGSDWIRFIQ